MLLIVSLISKINVWGFVGMLTGFWIVAASLFAIIKNFKNNKLQNIFKFFLINNAFLAHFGVGILILGITFSSVYKLEYQKSIAVNEKINFGNYELHFNSLQTIEKNNFKSIIGNFSLLKNGSFLGEIVPEKRYYYVSKIITTEAGIYHHPLQDFYLILGDQQNNVWSIKLYQNPLINFIWFGVVIMVISGILGLVKK